MKKKHFFTLSDNRYWLMLILLFVINTGNVVAQEKTQISQKNDSLHFRHFKSSELITSSVVNNFSKMYVNKTGGSVARILAAVSGTSFDGGLTSFRGLSGRYTAITINGLSAPTSEQNLKAFDISLLPGSALQEAKVYKGGIYSNYGEWGGGQVNIVNSADIFKSYTKLNVSVSHQNNFTFNDFYIPDESPNFFGYGVEDEKFTNDISSASSIQSMSRNDAAAEGSKLNNNYKQKKTNAIPSFDLGFSLGRILMQHGDRKFSTTASVAFKKSQNGMHFNRARYNDYERLDADADADPITNPVVNSNNTSYSTDGVYDDKANVYLSSAWFYQANKNNNINLSFLYGHEGRQRACLRNFYGIAKEKEVIGVSNGRIIKGIWQTRLSGEHNNMSDGKFDIDWTVGMGGYNRDEPDLKRFGGQRPLGSGDDVQYLMIIPSSAKADNGARFSSDLDDFTMGARVDLGYSVSAALKLKAGILYDYISRDFSARLVTAAKDDLTASELLFIPFKDYATCFAPENFSDNGYTLIDGTTKDDDYDGKIKTYAAYVGGEYEFNKALRLSLGLRYEKYNQTLNSGSANIDNTNNDFLPNVNLSFNTSRNSIVKLGYSHSVNRPAFRELAPFNFYDFDYRSDVRGNEELDNAYLDNFDLNFELLFGKNEYFVISPFYKHISDPIEMKYVITSDNPSFTFGNVEEANVGGVEVEIVKRLLTVPNNGFLLLSANMTYTSSNVELGEDTNEADDSRPLQGQIPLIFNSVVSYVSESGKTNASLIYRYQGAYLYSVGDGYVTFPWYVGARNLLGCSISHTFNKNYKLALEANNLLNTNFSQIEDADLDGEFDNKNTDKTVQRGFAYQTFKLSFKYNF